MVINPIVGVYIPIIRIPIKGGMTIPKKRDFWPWHIWKDILDSFQTLKLPPPQTKMQYAMIWGSFQNLHHV